MLTLLVPILITYLLDNSALKSAKRQAVQLHDNSLQWLKKIGPKYPEVRFDIRDLWEILIEIFFLRSSKR